MFLESFPGSPPFILSPSFPSFSTSFPFPSSHPLQSYSSLQVSLTLMILLLQHRPPPQCWNCRCRPPCSVSSVFGGGGIIKTCDDRKSKIFIPEPISLRLVSSEDWEFPEYFPCPFCLLSTWERTPRLQHDWGDSGPTGS